MILMGWWASKNLTEENMFGVAEICRIYGFLAVSWF